MKNRGNDIKVKTRRLILLAFFIGFSLCNGNSQVLTTEYIYDDLNRLTQVLHNNVAIEYCYDALGNRTCYIIEGDEISQPDLYVSSPTISASNLCNSASFNISYMEENLGIANSPGFYTHFILSEDATYEASSDNIIGSRYTTSIPSAGMNNIVQNLELPPGIPVTFDNLLIFVDKDSLVDELSETNNLISIPITLDQGNGFSVELCATNASCGNNDGTLTICNNTGNSPFIYEWSHDPGLSGSIATGLYPGIYYATITDANGCQESIFQEVLSDGELPAPSFTYSIDSLTVTFTNTTPNGDSYIWNFGDGNTSTDENPVYPFNDYGGYQVCIESLNFCGSNFQCVFIKIINPLNIPTCNIIEFPESNTNFKKVYPNNNSSKAISTVALSDNTLFSYSTNWSTKLSITKQDHSGNILNNTCIQISNPLRIQSLKEVDNQRVHFCGNLGSSTATFFGEFDFCGNLLWIKEIKRNWYEELYDFAQTADGGFLYSGTIYNSTTKDWEGFIAKISEYRQLEWSKSISVSGPYFHRLEFHSIIPGNQDSTTFKLVGRVYSYPGSTDISTVLFDIDLQGNIISKKVIKDNTNRDEWEAMSITKINTNFNSNYLITGEFAKTSGYALITDGINTIEKAITFSGMELKNGPVQHPDSSLFFLKDNRIVKVSDSLDFIKSIRIGNSDNTALSGLSHFDSSLVFSGSLDGIPFLAITNADLTSDCNQVSYDQSITDVTNIMVIEDVNISQSTPTGISVSDYSFNVVECYFDQFALCPLENCDITINVIGDTILCQNTNSTYQIAGYFPYSIDWFLNDIYLETTLSLDYDFPADGLYELKAVTNNGYCILSDSILINVKDRVPNNEIIITANQTNPTNYFANDGSIIQTLSYDYQMYPDLNPKHRWNTGDTTLSIENITKGNYLFNFDYHDVCTSMDYEYQLSEDISINDTIEKEFSITVPYSIKDLIQDSAGNYFVSFSDEPFFKFCKLNNEFKEIWCKEFSDDRYNTVNSVISPSVNPGNITLQFYYGINVVYDFNGNGGINEKRKFRNTRFGYPTSYLIKSVDTLYSQFRYIANNGGGWDPYSGSYGYWTVIEMNNTLNNIRNSQTSLVSFGTARDLKNNFVCGQMSTSRVADPNTQYARIIEINSSLDAVWHFDLDSPNSMFNSIEVLNDTIYTTGFISSNDTLKLIIMGIASGNIIWQKVLDVESEGFEIFIQNEHLICLSNVNGKTILLKLQKRDGSLISANGIDQSYFRNFIQTNDAGFLIFGEFSDDSSRIIKVNRSLEFPCNNIDYFDTIYPYFIDSNIHEASGYSTLNDYGFNDDASIPESFSTVNGFSYDIDCQPCENLNKTLIIDPIDFCQNESIIIKPSILEAHEEYYWLEENILIGTGDSIELIINSNSVYNYSLFTKSNICKDTSEIQIYPGDSSYYNFLEIYREDCHSSLLSVGLNFETILWSTGEEVSTITVENSGLYFATITDSNGCEYSDSIYVTIIPQLDIDSTIVHNTCDGNGSIELSVSGGNEPYNFFWSNGSISNNLTGLIGGSYSVTVSDAGSCSEIHNFNIEDLGPDLTLVKEDINCFESSGSINAIVTGNSGPYSFMWSNGGTSSHIENLDPGNYNLSITDNNNCEIVRSVALGGGPILPFQDTIICPGEELVLTIPNSVGTLDADFLWSNGLTGKSISISPLESVLLGVTYSGIEGTCYDEVNIIVDPGFTIQSNISNVSCNGENDGMIQLIIQGNTDVMSYEWSTTSTSSTITDLVAGQYVATITETNGCQIIKSYQIDEPQRFDVQFAIESESFCEAGDAFVAAVPSGGSGPFQFSWDNNLGTENLVIGLESGIYNITVTDNNNCSVDSFAMIFEPETTNVWTGTDGQWNANGFWSLDHIPVTCENVILRGPVGMMSTVEIQDIVTANIKSLVIEENIQLVTNGLLNIIGSDAVGLSVKAGTTLINYGVISIDQSTLNDLLCNGVVFNYGQINITSNNVNNEIVLQDMCDFNLKGSGSVNVIRN